MKKKKNKAFTKKKKLLRKKTLQKTNKTFAKLKPIKKELVKPTSAPSLYDPLSVYISQIQKYKILSKQEEKKIAIEYKKTGNKDLAQKLITSNLRFVVKIASQYSQLGVQLIELIQQGNIGLMHAVKEFNPYKDIRLITYAVWWIRGYIQEYLRNQYSIVKIGTTPEQRKLFYALQREKSKIDELGYSTVIRQLSGKLNIKEKDVKEMGERILQRDISLDQKIKPDQEKTFLEMQPEEESLEEKVAYREQIYKLKESIEKLKPQLNEKELFILNHRIMSDSPMTLQDIGNHRGVSRESIRQMEARIIQKIKNFTHKQLKKE